MIDIERAVRSAHALRDQVVARAAFGGEDGRLHRAVDAVGRRRSVVPAGFEQRILLQLARDKGPISRLTAPAA